MNPLEIHKHVAQSSGREVSEISPLADELLGLANQAAQEAEAVPDTVADFEQAIEDQKNDPENVLAQFEADRESVLDACSGVPLLESIYDKATDMQAATVTSMLVGIEDPQEAAAAREVAAYGFANAAIRAARADMKMSSDRALEEMERLDLPEILMDVELIIGSIYTEDAVADALEKKYVPAEASIAAIRPNKISAEARLRVDQVYADHAVQYASAEGPIESQNWLNKIKTPEVHARAQAAVDQWYGQHAIAKLRNESNVMAEQWLGKIIEPTVKSAVSDQLDMIRLDIAVAELKYGSRVAAKNWMNNISNASIKSQCEQQLVALGYTP
jgi:hypothetical protein